MSALLNHKATAIQKLTSCPLCGSVRRMFFKSSEKFADAAEPEGMRVHVNDFVVARYYCGFEISINEEDRILSRESCSLVSREKATKMNQDLEANFEGDIGEAA